MVHLGWIHLFCGKQALEDKPGRMGYTVNSSPVHQRTRSHLRGSFLVNTPSTRVRMVLCRVCTVAQAGQTALNKILHHCGVMFIKRVDDGYVILYSNLQMPPDFTKCLLNWVSVIWMSTIPVFISQAGKCSLAAKMLRGRLPPTDFSTILHMLQT